MTSTKWIEHNGKFTENLTRDEKTISHMRIGSYDGIGRNPIRICQENTRP